MFFLSVRHSINRFLSGMKTKNKLFKSTCTKGEQSRLIHRLNCIHLDDEEAKCLQGYITTILDKRVQGKSPETSGIVLEMDNEDFENFAYQVGSNGIRLFRALVQDDTSQSHERKLAIVGSNGIRVFHVKVQKANIPLRK
jgi:hypothetical protein